MVPHSTCKEIQILLRRSSVSRPIEYTPRVIIMSAQRHLSLRVLKICRHRTDCGWCCGARAPKFKILFPRSCVPRPIEYTCQVSSTLVRQCQSLGVLKIFWHRTYWRMRRNSNFCFIQDVSRDPQNIHAKWQDVVPEP